MPLELKVPAVGESITEVQIGKWLKNEGDRVSKDEALVEIETDKVTAELPAPEAGVLTKIIKRTGDQATVDEVIAVMEAGNGAAPPGGAPAPAPGSTPGSAAPAKSTPPSGPSESDRPTPHREEARPGSQAAEPRPTPAIPAPAPGEAAPVAPPERSDRVPPPKPPAPLPSPSGAPSSGAGAASGAGAGTGGASGGREEEVVPMTPLRRRIAQRLVEAQHNAALLTTFNEIDMTGVMELRAKLQESFQARYGIKLGFMSFFVKAAVHALKLVPQVNAEVRGGDVVYHNYYDIGIAIGGGKGLVVPILRNAERLSFAGIEKAIAEFAQRAKDNKLELHELQGGTFTISNGGVYGSLLSTPIVNPPQSGILGLHTIQKRAVVLPPDDRIVARPMMYVALTYDHRVVDGREAVTFLKHIKEVTEEPARMLLEA